MKSKLAAVWFIGLIMTLSMTLAHGGKNGLEKMDLFGGTRGKVPFPHHQHQKSLKDCNTCHSVFPQKPGSIEDMKKNGALKKKYVMNVLCTKCHKAEKKAGNPSGPTTCSKCHMRQE